MTMPNLRTADEGRQRAVQLLESTTHEFNTYLQGVNSGWQAMTADYAEHSANVFGRGVDAWENQFVVIINNLIDMMQKMGVATDLDKNADEDGTARPDLQAY
jgi:hypothetical protein